MQQGRWFRVESPKPIAVGAGLIALDLVINGKPEVPRRCWAGGTAGNVLIILSYLGWEAYPIARLKDGRATDLLLKDLKRWEVDTSLVYLDTFGVTPIVVERLRRSEAGVVKHKYEWTCPDCGSWLPRFRPLPTKAVAKIVDNMPTSQVFFFDRVARSSIDLAHEAKSKGALVVFEPSEARKENLLPECLKVADVVKYSSDRQKNLHETTDDIEIPLEIETNGAEGLRYRIRRSCGSRPWRTMPAFSVDQLRDAAGSGDWCSAGLLHLLAQSGRKGFEEAGSDHIEDALRFGQALAAFNCQYEGPRGAMYQVSKRTLGASVAEALEIGMVERVEEQSSRVEPHGDHFICPNCRPSVGIGDTES